MKKEINSMLNRALLFAIALVFISCSSEQPEKGPFVLTGTVKNFDKSDIEFSHREYKLLSSQEKKDVKINEDGTFKMRIETEAPTKGFFSFGSVPATYEIDVKTKSGEDSTMTRGTNDFRLVYFYLQPGDSVHMDVDVEDISNTLSFSGTGAENNTFVNLENDKFNSYENKVLNNSYNILTWGPERYKNIINKQKKEKLAFLEDYTSKNDISDHLQSVYKWKYHGDAASAKINYKARREGFINKDVDLPDDYYNFMDNVKLADDFSDKGIGYFYFLDGYFKKKYELEKNEEPAADKAYYDFVENTVDGKPAYEYFAFALSRDFNRDLYSHFNDDSPYPELAEDVRKYYKHMEGMLAGSPAPKITLTDLEGNTKPLSSLQGKNIYIDFWATWCKPCIKEIPYIDELKEEYEGKNIAFVSISFDSEEDKEKWKNFVDDRDLSGPQYWVDEENHNAFSSAFNIQMIPRFVMIDDEGKIVDANAPRPSDAEKVRSLIDNELSRED